MPKYVVLFKYTGAIEGGGPERFARARQIATDSSRLRIVPGEGEQE